MRSRYKLLIVGVGIMQAVGVVIFTPVSNNAPFLIDQFRLQNWFQPIGWRIAAIMCRFHQGDLALVDFAAIRQKGMIAGCNRFHDATSLIQFLVMQLELFEWDALTTVEISNELRCIRAAYYRLRLLRKWRPNQGRRRQLYRQIASHKKSLLMAGFEKRALLDFLGCCRNGCQQRAGEFCGYCMAQSKQPI